MSSRSIQLRLFITCWMIFVLHFATDFVREHYLVLSIVEDHSFRLDKYAGLHDDIFQTPDHGAHHSANPGASMVAAIPYLLFRPVTDRIIEKYSVTKPDSKITAVYNDPRPARVKFYKEVRERGLDIKFGLVAFITMAFCMAPLSAFSAVILFRTLGQLKISSPISLWMALLYAFGTPIFFRTGYLSHNLMLGIFAFIAFTLLWRPGEDDPSFQGLRYALAGFLAGLAFLCDYSGLIILILFAIYGVLRQKDFASKGQALRTFAWYVCGAAGPVCLLWFYQWRSFGHAFYPPQHYMPAQNVWVGAGYKGFAWPGWDLVWMLMFDQRIGLFVVSPILSLALLAPLLIYFRKNLIPLRETMLILLLFAGFVLFFSFVQYTRLQWITGIRYLVPVVPFLFLLTVTVLVRMPRMAVFLLGILAVGPSWCLAMARSQEGPLASVESVLLQGFQLPWLTTLTRMAPQYAPFLANGASPLPLFVLWMGMLYGLWHVNPPRDKVRKNLAP